MKPDWIAISVAVLVVGGLGGYGWIEHQKRITVTAQYAKFVAETKAAAAQQLAENAKKETEYAKALHTAESGRDAAVIRLRHEQERARASRMSIVPETPGDRICFTRSGFDSALQTFLGTVEGLVAEGDRALIDKEILLKAWPP